MRGFLVGVFILLGLVVVPLGDFGIWTGRHLFDTESFVTLANDVVQDDAVAAALSDRLVQEIVRRQPRLERSAAIVQRGTRAAISTSVFQRVFSGAAGSMQRQLDRGDDALVLQISDLLPSVEQSVAKLDPRVAELIPQEGLPAVTVVRTTDAPAIWRGVDLARTASWALPLLAVGLLGAAIVLARRRTVALIAVGVGVAIMAVVVVAMLRVGRGLLSDGAGTQVGQEAFDAAWDTVTSPLITQSLLLAVAGGVVAGVGALVAARTGKNRRPVEWA